MPSASSGIGGAAESEDEHQQILGIAAEAHSGLKEIAFRLRRQLGPKAPALKAALKVEQEAFRLKRELQRLDLEDPVQGERRQALPDVRRGGKVVDIERLRR